MAVETILIVDDAETNRVVAEKSLVGAGYAVIKATSGPQALEIIKEKSPDLILLDVVMPGMTGFEVCKAVRAMPQGADVPIVFLTGLSDPESQRNALEAGGDDLLNKPFNGSELLIRVRSMLWLKRLRGELRSGYQLISSQRDALIATQRQKQDLINLVVHDLKNPLTNIIGYVQLIMKWEQEKKDERILNAAGRIQISASAMHRMVMNMLDIGRSEDGALRLQLAPVDVGLLVEEVKSNMQGRTMEKPAKLVVTDLSAGKGIRADGDFLRRILENLIDNAIRFSPSGGKVTLEARVEDGAFEARVSDQGHGIPAELRERVFEKYSQPIKNEDGATNRGLGLTFCRLATEAHGGEIWIEDNKPQGACFCVRIPDAPAPN